MTLVELEQAILEVKSRTDQPFGVNLRADAGAVVARTVGTDEVPATALVDVAGLVDHGDVGRHQFRHAGGDQVHDAGDLRLVQRAAGVQRQHDAGAASAAASLAGGLLDLEVRALRRGARGDDVDAPPREPAALRVLDDDVRVTRLPRQRNQPHPPRRAASGHRSSRQVLKLAAAARMA